MVVRPLKTYRSEMRKLSEKMGVIENTMTKQEAENLDAMLVEIAAARWQLPMLEAFKECMSSEVIHSISTKNDRANIFVCFASIRDSARDPENDLDSMMHEFNDIVAKLTLPDSALGISELVALEFRIQTVLSKFAGPVPPPVHERVINDESTQHTQSGEREHADSINDDDDDDDDEAGEGPATQAPRDDSDDEDDGKEAKAGKSDKSSDGSSEASALRTDPPSKDPATKLRKAIDSTWVEEDDIMSAEDNINLWPARAAAKLARDSLEEIVEAYRTAQRSRPRGNRRGGQNQSDKNLQDAHNLFWAFETAHSWPDFIKLLEEFMRFCQTFVVQHPPKLLQLMRQGRQAISRASSQSASMHGNDDDDDVVIRNRNTSLLGPATPRSHLRRPTKVAQHSSAAPRSAHQQHMASSSSPPSNRVQGGIPRSKLYTQLQNEFLRRHGNSYEEWEKLRNLTPFDAREKVTTFVQSAVAANSSMPPTRSADIIVHHNSNHDSHHHHHNHHQHESDELLDESRFHYNMHGSHSKRKLHAEVPKHYASGKRSRHHDDDHDDGFPHMAPMDDNDDRDTVVDAAKALRENSRMLRNKFKDPLDLMLLQSKKLTIQPAATSSGLAEGESSPTSTMAGARPRPRAKRRLEYDSNPENDSPFASQFGQDENRSPAHQDDRASHINSDTLFERAIKPLRKTRRKPVPWTMKETDALVNGVRLHGKGNWAEILRENRPAFHSTRTSVSLKDRYRNIELKRVKDDKDEAESAAAE